MRTALICSFGLLAFSAVAQDQDLFVEGKLTDAATGAPLSTGTIDVFNEVDTGFAYGTDCGLDGAYRIDMYVWDSSYYVISFNAPGHVTRRAVIDLTGLNVELDADMAWTITMNVALSPDEGKATDAKADDLLGFAQFDNKDKTIRWSGAGAKEKYPVKRTRLARLPSASEKINELYDKEGSLVSGTVRDHWSDAPVAGVSVDVSTEGGYNEKTSTDQYGVYGVILPYDRVYDMRFEKEGWVTKRVEFNNKNIPE